jgi:hypothetical protein
MRAYRRRRRHGLRCVKVRVGRAELDGLMPCEAPLTMAVLLPAMLNPCFYLQEWGMPQINLASINLASNVRQR